MIPLNFSIRKYYNNVHCIFSDKNIVVMMLNHCFDTILSKFESIDQFLCNEKFKNFQEIWNNSCVRMAVDGGANVLYDMQQSNAKYDGQLLDPTFLSGDFDSIHPKVMDHFKQRGENIKIMHTPDPDHTDFTKALFILDEQVLNLNTTPEIDCILVFFSNSGRIDQYLSILSTVHNFSNNNKTFPPIILVDMVDSISFVLKKVSHTK